MAQKHCLQKKEKMPLSGQFQIFFLKWFRCQIFDFISFQNFSVQFQRKTFQKSLHLNVINAQDICFLSQGNVKTIFDSSGFKAFHRFFQKMVFRASQKFANNRKKIVLRYLQLLLLIYFHIVELSSHLKFFFSLPNILVSTSTV